MYAQLLKYFSSVVLSYHAFHPKEGTYITILFSLLYTKWSNMKGEVLRDKKVFCSLFPLFLQILFRKKEAWKYCIILKKVSQVNVSVYQIKNVGFYFIVIIITASVNGRQVSITFLFAPLIRHLPSLTFIISWHETYWRAKKSRKGK